MAWFWHSLVLQSPGVFPPGGDFFRNCFTASSRQQQNLSKNCVFPRMSDDTLGTSIYLVYISIGFQTSRLAVFSFIWHQWVSRTWARARKRAATAAAAVSCFGSCLIAAARQQHHSSSSHQQQHQQQAAGSRRQQQAAVGSSRHKQTQQQ